MSEGSLSTAVGQLVHALNTGDADKARDWCTEAAWTGGVVPLESLCRDVHLLLTAAPVMLQTDARGVARLAGMRPDKTRDSLWLQWVKGEARWTCVGAVRTRMDAEGFLASTEPVADAPATAPSLVDGRLVRVVDRLVAALSEADDDAGRALAEADAWDLPGDSLARVFQHVRRTRPDLEILEYRIRGDRAAVHLALVGRGGGDTLWVAWRRRAGEDWRVAGVSERWEPAGLFVDGTTPTVPTWEGLPADAAAARWGQGALAALADEAGPPSDVPDDAWRTLGAPPAPGRVLRLGPAASLPALNRALVTIEEVDPDTDFAVDERHALLVRADADQPWRFAALVGMPGLASLLEGVEVPWEAPESPAAEASELNDEVKRRILEMLRAQGVDPALLGDVSKLSREQLEAMVPQLVGGALTALFGTLFGKLKDTLDEAAARDPNVTVDLERERARREGRPVPDAPPEDAVSREVRAALRDVLSSASVDGETRVDTDFFKKEGPRLVGSLFGAVAKALVPAEVTLDVQPDPDAADDEPVKVKLELGELFGRLFQDVALATGATNREDEE